MDRVVPFVCDRCQQPFDVLGGGICAECGRTLCATHLHRVLHSEAAPLGCSQCGSAPSVPVTRRAPHPARDAARRVYVDLMKTDARRRILLHTVGTRADLQRFGIELSEGLALAVYCDDLDDLGRENALVADGVVTWDSEAQRWVLDIDWGKLRHESDSRVD